MKKLSIILVLVFGFNNFCYSQSVLELQLIQMQMNALQQEQLEQQILLNQLNSYAQSLNPQPMNVTNSTQLLPKTEVECNPNSSGGFTCN